MSISGTPKYYYCTECGSHSSYKPQGKHIQLPERRMCRCPKCCAVTLCVLDGPRGKRKTLEKGYRVTGIRGGHA